MRLISKIQSVMDELAGLDHVSPLHRRIITAGQIQGLLQMAPLAAFGAVLAMALALSLLWPTEARNATLAIFSAIAFLQFLSVRAFYKSRNILARVEGNPRTLRAVIVNAALYGCLWGILSILVLGYVAPSGLFISGILLAGILMTTVYCFRTVLQASFAFIGISGILLAFAFTSRPESIGVLPSIALIALYFTVVPYIAFLQTRDFISHFRGELKSQDEAELSNALLDQFEETGHEWFWAADSDGTLERASEELRSVLANADARFLNVEQQACLILCDKREPNVLAEALQSKNDFQDVKVPIDLDGVVHWIAFTGRVSVRDDGSFSGYIGVCADVTKEKQAEEKIVEMAMMDGLTNLHNRTSFYAEMDTIVRRLERYGTPFSLMFLDLDKFKLVNDSYGHHVGDGLLKEAASRILKVLRGNDVVGRLGGDEFAIIVEETSDPVFIAKLAARIIQEVSLPYKVEGETLYIGVSVGVALAPVHGTQREQLLRNADLALYRAKDDGRGVFRYFEAQMDFEQRERRMLEQEMRQALTDEEFEMKFQPMICTKTGRVVCMEALIRWNHEIRGLLPPDEFIYIAEQSNLIVDVGRWSLLSACRTATSWPEDVSVAVNVSALHFMRSDVIGDIADVLKATGLPPSRLEIEITESILIDHNDETVTKLRGLKDLGITIAMDDFGTGYSSLGYLTRFRFDRLKIDKSFLKELDKNDDRKAIVYAISTLGENLGIAITVEGVETIEHVEFLKTIYCDQAQGFYYSRPISADQVAGFVLKTFSETVAIKPVKPALVSKTG